MFNAKKTPLSRRASAGLAILFGVIFLGGALTGVAWWSVASLQKDTLTRIDFARHYLDTILSHAQDAAMATKKHIGAACTNDTLTLLRHNVILTPNVRSIELAAKGHIYCASLYGPTVEVDNTNDVDTQGPLRLISGDTATPDLSVLLYRETTAQGSVIVGIDGYFIANTLFVIHTLPSAYFQVGKTLLSSQGEILTSAQLPVGQRDIIPSTTYPYQLVTVTSHNVLLKNMTQNYQGSGFCSLLAAIAIALLSYRMLTRPLSPLEQLKNGMARHEFVPYIQPIVDLTTHSIKGGEILVRWAHPHMGLIPPSQFIPLAEASGLIVPMTRQLFSDTRQFFSSHIDTLPSGFHLGFNISQTHLQDSHIISDCQKILTALSSCHIELVLELLERDTAECTDDIQIPFNALRQMGVKFALDDFGTGYSTHAYLQHFTVDYIKIDKSFIQMIGLDDISKHIVDNVIALAENLNIDIVAEGVETKSQEVYLQLHHVRYLQGYRYGHPMPLDQFITTYLSS